MITKDRLIELANAKAEAQKAYTAAYKVANAENNAANVQVEADLNARHWNNVLIGKSIAYNKALNEYMKQEAFNG